MKFSNLKFSFVFLMFYSIINTNCFAGNNDSLKTDIKQTIFGSIHTGFYYGLNDESKPKSAFELNGGLLGYSHKFASNVKATLIYDVTRTTNFASITDSNGYAHNVNNYFEGSKYTAYLKQAQIDWNINKYFDFSVGQLLNEQYLTFTDKFWGYRYIFVTFQEAYKFGNPADFGARVTFKLKDKFQYSISAFNGEGPFRYQDVNSKYLVSNNIEFRPTKELVFKLYYDYEQPSDTLSSLKPKYVISGFTGYKTDRFRIGLEYNSVNNYKYVAKDDFWGTSAYISVKVFDKIEILGRYDYIGKATNTEKGQYLIAGFQYEPAKNFMMSINYRQLTIDKSRPQIYANFGVKF